MACLGLAGAEARNSASSTPSSSLYSNHVPHFIVLIAIMFAEVCNVLRACVLKC